ncbi:unnamed protein product [marine sediment metagenome]|uniref:Uncharacterized protein n=1 Tax=marine sediment metagenome TaxID=412755 RepID=X1G7F5_9ZZZZ
MWFKYLVFALFIFEAMLSLARAGGWEEKRKSPSVCFLAAIVSALVAVGIWFWL